MVRYWIMIVAAISNAAYVCVLYVAFRLKYSIIDFVQWFTLVRNSWQTRFIRYKQAENLIWKKIVAW